MMEKYPAALIWASKQYLGQTDQQEVKIQTTEDDSIKEMEDYFDRRKQERNS